MKYYEFFLRLFYRVFPKKERTIIVTFEDGDVRTFIGKTTAESFDGKLSVIERTYGGWYRVTWPWSLIAEVEDSYGPEDAPLTAADFKNAYGHIKGVR